MRTIPELWAECREQCELDQLPPALRDAVAKAFEAGARAVLSEVVDAVSGGETYVRAIRVISGWPPDRRADGGS